MLSLFLVVNFTSYLPGLANTWFGLGIWCNDQRHGVVAICCKGMVGGVSSWSDARFKSPHFLRPARRQRFVNGFVTGTLLSCTNNIPAGIRFASSFTNYLVMRTVILLLLLWHSGIHPGLHLRDLTAGKLRATLRHRLKTRQPGNRTIQFAR